MYTTLVIVTRVKLGQYRVLHGELATWDRMAGGWGYSLTGPLAALSAKATGCTDVSVQWTIGPTVSPHAPVPVTEWKCRLVLLAVKCRR